MSMISVGNTSEEFYERNIFNIDSEGGAVSVTGAPLDELGLEWEITVVRPAGVFEATSVDNLVVDCASGVIPVAIEEE